MMICRRILIRRSWNSGPRCRPCSYTSQAPNPVLVASSELDPPFQRLASRIAFSTYASASFRPTANRIYVCACSSRTI
ncbi:hypothetical protein SLA2020_400650 [Shorea laevis]